MKPWPDPPPTNQTLSWPGRRSIRKSPFELFSYWQTRAWISGDLRGWWIGLIGLAKVGLQLAVVGSEYGAEYHVSGWVFAAVVNLSFAAQVIIAGGMTDELGKRIADYLRSAGPLRARLFHNVAGR